ncbi:DoxX family membrane protein [Parvibaculum sedimenti]|uniref:DoxX family membrane protein n=1 Tax=Parvibaculum sedimenti TaxID=2608632 RepID=A0A6N6VKH7_9HYPH|nr:DoxX family protein [Parvibaculum sedimenti]KAB7740465.1 DoxX family membrane protein [Parvibaculum sedimenti]
MDSLTRLAAPLGRLLLSLIFIIAGIGKATSATATIGYIASKGIPLPEVSYVLTLIVELGGGALILIGYQTRIVAFLLAGFCIVTGLIFHNDFADQTMFIMFMKNLAMAGGFLQLVAHGAGAYSIDNRGKA